MLCLESAIKKTDMAIKLISPDTLSFVTCVASYTSHVSDYSDTIMFHRL